MNKYFSETLYNKKIVLNWLNKKETKALFILILVTVLFRIFFLQNIEDRGDGIFYWEAAKNLSLKNTIFEYTHWSTRFTIVLPLAVLQKIFNYSPFVYYILPLSFSILQTIMLYKIVIRAINKDLNIFIAQFTVIFFLIYPQLLRNGSQLLPGIISSALITCSAFYLIKIIDSTKNNYLYLIISAFFLFLAYGTKITNIFFLPGIIISIWMITKNLKYIFVYGLILVLFFSIETFHYLYYTDFAFGRLSIILGSHLSHYSVQKPIGIFDIFYRFVRPGPHYTLLFLFYLYSGCSILKKKDNIALSCIVIISLSFFICITFAIKSINPITLLLNMQTRYLVAAQSLMFITIITHLTYLVVRHNKLILLKKISGIVCALIIIFYAILFRNNFINHPLYNTLQLDNTIDYALNNNIPIFYPYDDAKTWNQYKKIHNSVHKIQTTGSFKTEKKGQKILKNIRLISLIFNNDSKESILIASHKCQNNKDTLFLVKEANGIFNDYYRDKTVPVSDKNGPVSIIEKKRPLIIRRSTVAQLYQTD